MTDPDLASKDIPPQETEILDLAAILERISQGVVLCVGDVMLDQFIEGKVNRISPEAPIPVLAIERERMALGGAANVARNLSALGVECRLIGVVGRDPAAREVQSQLDNLDKVEAQLIACTDRPTAVKTRFMAGRAQLLRADAEKVGPLLEEDATALRSVALSLMQGAGALILSDYGKGVLTDGLCADLIATAEEMKIPVIVDPKGSDYRKYTGADFVTPNRAELSLASGLPTDTDEEILAACAVLTAVKGVIATRSEQGMTVFHRMQGSEPSIHHLPARAREVFDVAGAGDTVVAALAAGLAVGYSPETAAKLANRAAGIVVAKAGTAVAYPSEILNDGHEERLAVGEAKTATLAEALDRIAVWRRAGKKVGFTNGCFDLLHPGHISLIGQARAACDRLILGLNSDASVKRLKGESRPVQPEEARATVLAALEDVDMVVLFGEDTPLELIRSLEPDVLIKGADYTKDQVVGADLVEARGGQVVLANLVEGQSTTRTIERLGQKPS